MSSWQHLLDVNTREQTRARFVDVFASMAIWFKNLTKESGGALIISGGGALFNWAMAEFVEWRIQETIPEVEELERMEILSKLEVK